MNREAIDDDSLWRLDDLVIAAGLVATLAAMYVGWI